MKNAYAELLAVLESDASNRSLEISGKRRETIIDALRIAAANHLPPIPNATDTEKRIVGKLVEDFLAQGIGITVNDGEDDALINSVDADEIYAALGSTGADTLKVMINGKVRSVLLVWGNDAAVISDYSVVLEPYLAGANALADELDR